MQSYVVYALADSPIQNFFDEFVYRAGGVGVEFVGGSVGQQGAEAVGFVA